ncbi:TetR/AcrR family transcriptional regulator [Azonexus sp.]|uniref:TetR/AcrR family transcriptional regulator n=1 Tax=Azonexus sp. TaxID=1872668 RepID=UPI0027B88BE3|nr:TetR/AcrR family transcriptional regulator [Azonexus sp.]
MKKNTKTRCAQNNRRGEILVAAAALFRDKGFGASTIRDITNTVGIASGSTFCHFKSKREILDAIAIEGMRQVLLGAEALERRRMTPEERLRTLMRQHVGFLHDAPTRDFVTVLLYESRELSDAARAEVMVLMERYETIWKNCLRRLAPAAKGGIKESLLHRLLFGALNWTVHWYSPGADLPPERLAEELAELVLPGMKDGSGKALS